MATAVAPIVVDNASSDRTLDSVVAGIQVISNRENRGFAAAANQGFRATDADLVLLLNPDVKLLTPVDELMDAARIHGMAAGKLVDGEGLSQSGFSIRRFPTPASLIFESLGVNRLFPWNPVNRRYRYLDRSLDRIGEVDQPAGAFLMIRRDIWEKLGGFDEAFHPIWFEDVDFCHRAREAGYRIQYIPAVVAAHTGAHSIHQLPEGTRALYWCASLLRYAAKYFQPVAYRAVCVAVVLGSIPRMFAGMIRERSLAPIVDFCKVIQFAGLCLVSSRRRGVVPNS